MKKSIKCVDFKIEADGHGVVNWNGSEEFMVEVQKKLKIVDNHTLPKLRGFTPYTGKVKESTGFKYRKSPQEVNLEETPLYVSQNCLRHYIFKETSFDVHFAGDKAHPIIDILASDIGMLRGYAVPTTFPLKRNSPFLLEDLIAYDTKANYEQFSTCGPRNNSSLYSKTTVGNTKYVSYGSVSVENLQFISLDRKFDRQSLILNKDEGPDVASRIENYLVSINSDNQLNPKAVYNENYVRVGQIYNEGEHGILLNDDAQQVLVNHLVYKIRNTSIFASKAWLRINNVTVDYNAGIPMRIKDDMHQVNQNKDLPYSVYFEVR